MTDRIPKLAFAVWQPEHGVSVNTVRVSREQVQGILDAAPEKGGSIIPVKIVPCSETGLIRSPDAQRAYAKAGDVEPMTTRHNEFEVPPLKPDQQTHLKSLERPIEKPLSQQFDDLIKPAMEECGLPNSRSVYQAMKKIAWAAYGIGNSRPPEPKW